MYKSIQKNDMTTITLGPLWFIIPYYLVTIWWLFNGNWVDWVWPSACLYIGSLNCSATMHLQIKVVGANNLSSFKMERYNFINGIIYNAVACNRRRLDSMTEEGPCVFLKHAFKVIFKKGYFTFFIVSQLPVTLLRVAESWKQAIFCYTEFYFFLSWLRLSSFTASKEDNNGLQYKWGYSN